MRSLELAPEGPIAFDEGFPVPHARHHQDDAAANCSRANYHTTKNKRTMAEKFEIKKFCPACRKHFPHKEGKISKG